MVGGIDCFGFFDRTVIQPQNHVAICFEVGAGDGNGLIIASGENAQRTCRVEANSSNGVRIDIILADGTVDSGADAPPDVRRGLFLEIGTVSLGPSA